MKKLILFAALVCAASMWAQSSFKEGPWTQIEWRTRGCAKHTEPLIAYQNLNNSSWSGATITGWNDGKGIGFTVTGSSPDNHKKMTVFSLYVDSVLVPAYTSMRLTWTYQLASLSTKHHSTTCLYGRETEEQIKSMVVDFSDEYITTTGSEYLLARLSRTDQEGEVRYTENTTYTFELDNRNGSTEQIKTWYLLMTYVIGSGDDGKKDLNEWGAFKSLNIVSEDTYYKVVSFNAHGGSGTMDELILENGGNLTENTFVREGYEFAGWSTEPNDTVVYPDGAEMTVSEEDRGHVTLYAQWTPEHYNISYELNGGTATNPQYYTIEDSLTLATPTRANHTFLGWTGSNGSIPQTGVAIAKGSTGAKNYTAHWMSNAINSTIDLISAIGEVCYTEECKAKIDDAREAYEALTKEQKALVINYSALTAAEAAYEAAKDAAGSSTIHFVKQDSALISSMNIDLVYPEAPEIEGFTFLYWQVVEKNLSDDIIRLQAVYQDNSQGMEDVNSKAKAAKLLRNGNVYILVDDKTYTITGQKTK